MIASFIAFKVERIKLMQLEEKKKTAPQIEVNPAQIFVF